MSFVTITFVCEGQRILIEAKTDELFAEVVIRYYNKIGKNYRDPKFFFESRELLPESGKTLADYEICKHASIDVVIPSDVIGGGCPLLEYNKEINIKFIKISKKIPDKIQNTELIGLLKLCFLKELSSKLSPDDLKQLPDLTQYIMSLLIKGYIKDFDINFKETIKKVLERMQGSNIINFSDFVDEVITTKQINEMLNLLNSEDSIEINNIRFSLSKYNQYIEIFNKEFERAKKESIFEFSIISLVIMEREDFEKFKQEREKCPNRIDKILFHGTRIEPISCILTGLFNKSVDRCFQHGKGVYFTDFLDYCWFYGGDVSNRANKNKIPKIGDNFTLIVCSVYYDKNGFKKVIDYKRKPSKNEIYFAYAGAEFETLVIPDFKRFVGNEYVIWDLEQICPFMSARLIRNEFCVIWRDNNFSSKPIYNNKFDAIFKKFLNERIKYIKQFAKFNIYPCETSEKALKLIERKKYNKIILISNIGTDLGGKKFVTEARKILGNDVIALFLAYNAAHLNWVKNYKNALFSSDPAFYEEYLQCFEKGNNIKENIKSLIKKMENHYKITFKFDDNFLNFPKFKESGKYSDLSFNN